MDGVKSLVSAVRGGLAELANAAKAPDMQAYMKSEMPFRGVQKLARAALLKQVIAENPLPDKVSFSSAVLTLWRTAEFREERYAAVDLSGNRAYARWQDSGLLDLYEEMIVSGAWRDYVDEIAKTEPEWVRAFVTAHPGLSPLSRREALKHLGSA